MSENFYLEEALNSKSKRGNNQGHSSVDTEISSSSEKSSNKVTFEIIDKESLNEYHIFKETKLLINKYGITFFDTLKKEDSSFNQDNLTRHSLSPNIRAKMVDWMLEIFRSYKSEPRTFFLSVYIMDLYLQKTFFSISNDDIHIIGLCCIYIASKMEDLLPIHLNHIVNKIGYNKFTPSQIQKKEKEILVTIDFELIHSSVYDFVKTFLLDFSFNNQEIVKVYMNNAFTLYEDICIYLSKLTCLSWEFSFFSNYLKGVCILVLGFDILRSRGEGVDKNVEIFLREWINFVIKESQIDRDELSTVYEKLMMLYQLNISGGIGTYLLAQNQ